MSALVRSGLGEIAWPGLPDQRAATLLALQYQFNQTERMETAALQQLQFAALHRLLQHARATVPFYRDRAAYDVVGHGGALEAAAWEGLPVLTRAEAQDAGEALRSSDIPADHQPVREVTTSGSTGRPLTVLVTGVTGLFWDAITVRDHLWHERDAGGHLAVIRPDPHRALPPEGRIFDTWGGPIAAVFPTGPLGMMSLQTDVAAQAEWLVAQNPHYLLSLPSNLFALAQHFADTSGRLPRLRNIVSIGETLSPEVRAVCVERWGARVDDIYSSQELGYIALQCNAGRYHAQSEVAYVEVLDEAGRPCGPGQTGRVVVTAMHNFAMPLVRYEVGDYAEVGDICECGRMLPVLTRVLGRQRNMLTLPSGERRWPTFARAWEDIECIRQIQLVQVELDHVRARIVGPRALDAQEESRFATELRKALDYPFRVTFEYLPRIDRSTNSKFEDFVSLVSPDGSGSPRAAATSR